MTITTQKLTFEDYLTYEDDTDNRYELVNGELLQMGIGSGIHALIIDFLVDQFKVALLASKEDLEEPLKVMAGSVGVRSPRGGRWDTSRIPDMAILPSAQMKEMANREAVIRLNEAAPQLVVEVVSPSTKKVDYRSKWAEYAVLNIPEYWIVDPLNDLVTICVLEDGIYISQEFCGEQMLPSSLFPNLILTAAQVLFGEL